MSDKKGKPLVNVTGFYHQKSHENLAKAKEESDKKSRKTGKSDDSKSETCSKVAVEKGHLNKKNLGEDATFEDVDKKTSSGKSPRKGDQVGKFDRKGSPRKGKSRESTESEGTPTKGEHAEEFYQKEDAVSEDVGKKTSSAKSPRKGDQVGRFDRNGSPRKGKLKESTESEGTPTKSEHEEGFYQKEDATSEDVGKKISSGKSPRKGDQVGKFDRKGSPRKGKSRKSTESEGTPTKGEHAEEFYQKEDAISEDVGKKTSSAKSPRKGDQVGKFDRNGSPRKGKLKESTESEGTPTKSEHEEGFYQKEDATSEDVGKKISSGKSPRKGDQVGKLDRKGSPRKGKSKESTESEGTPTKGEHAEEFYQKSDSRSGRPIEAKELENIYSGDQLENFNKQSNVGRERSQGSAELEDFDTKRRSIKQSDCCVKTGSKRIKSKEPADREKFDKGEKPEDCCRETSPTIRKPEAVMERSPRTSEQAAIKSRPKKEKPREARELEDIASEKNNPKTGDQSEHFNAKKDKSKDATELEDNDSGGRCASTCEKPKDFERKNVSKRGSSTEAKELEDTDSVRKSPKTSKQVEDFGRQSNPRRGRSKEAKKLEDIHAEIIIEQPECCVKTSPERRKSNESTDEKQLYTGKDCCSKSGPSRGKSEGAREREVFHTERSPRTGEQLEDFGKRSRPRKGKSRDGRDLKVADSGRRSPRTGEQSEDSDIKSSPNRSREAVECKHKFSSKCDLILEIPRDCCFKTGPKPSKLPDCCIKTDLKREKSKETVDEKDVDTGEEVKDCCRETGLKKAKSKETIDGEYVDTDEEVEDCCKKAGLKKADSMETIDEENVDTGEEVKNYCRKKTGLKRAKSMETIDEEDAGTGEEVNDCCRKTGLEKVKSKEAIDEKDHPGEEVEDCCRKTGLKRAKSKEAVDKEDDTASVELKDCCRKSSPRIKKAEEATESEEFDTGRTNPRTGKQPEDQNTRKSSEIAECNYKFTSKCDLMIKDWYIKAAPRTSKEPDCCIKTGSKKEKLMNVIDQEGADTAEESEDCCRKTSTRIDQSEGATELEDFDTAKRSPIMDEQPEDQKRDSNSKKSREVPESNYKYNSKWYLIFKMPKDCCMKTGPTTSKEPDCCIKTGSKKEKIMDVIDQEGADTAEESEDCCRKTSLRIGQSEGATELEDFDTAKRSPIMDEQPEDQKRDSNSKKSREVPESNYKYNSKWYLIFKMPKDCCMKTGPTTSKEPDCCIKTGSKQQKLTDVIDEEGADTGKESEDCCRKTSPRIGQSEGATELENFDTGGSSRTGGKPEDQTTRNSSEVLECNYKFTSKCDLMIKDWCIKAGPRRSKQPNCCNKTGSKREDLKATIDEEDSDSKDCCSETNPRIGQSEDAKEWEDFDTGNNSSKTDEQPEDVDKKSGPERDISKVTIEWKDVDIENRSLNIGEQSEEFGPRRDISRRSIQWEDFDIGRSPTTAKLAEEVARKNCPRRELSRGGIEAEDLDTGRSVRKTDEQAEDVNSKNVPRKGSSKVATEWEDYDQEGPSGSKKRPTITDLHTGRPQEETELGDFDGESGDFCDDSSKKGSLMDDQKVIEYVFAPRSAKPRKGEEASLELARESSAEFSVQSEDETLDMSESTKQGETQADFILVYVTKNDKQFGKNLELYLANLKSRGLVLESVTSKNYKKTTFIKVHVPKGTAAMELAKQHDIPLACINPFHTREGEAAACMCCLDTNLTSPTPNVHVYIRNRESVKGKQPKEPTSAERIMIAYEELMVAKFGDGSADFGIEEMMKRDIIAAAYPVHDGGWEWSDKGFLNDRQLLKAYWANMFGVYNVQPIQLIKKYFGLEAGFYFAMLGWHMIMLIPAALLGLIPFIYGLNPTNPVIDQVCGSEDIMCPVCKNPTLCGYSLLRGSCNFIKLNFLVDNEATIPYGVVMTFWGVLFVALWERKSSILKVGWNIPRFLKLDITIRPDYYKKTEELYKSPITGKVEPYVRKQLVLQNWLVSISGMLGMILIVFFALLQIILFRVKLTNFLTKSRTTKWGEVKVVLRGDASIDAAVASAIFGTVIIIILDCVYERVVIYLTNIENHRTQREYDESYIAKLIFFKVANSYTLPIYLALFRNIGYSNPRDTHWDYLFGVNADICDLSGCATDIWIFVIVIIIAKSLYNVSKNVAVPILLKMWKQPGSTGKRPQWETDYDLVPIPKYFITKLNMELLIQYGFVVSFGSAFQLLPLIVLVLNIIELRIYAWWFVRFSQRLVPRQPYELGIWSKVLYPLTFAGLIINALIVGVTANSVDRILYRYSQDKPTLEGFANAHMVSWFNTTGYPGEQPVGKCYYPGSRVPGNGEYDYSTFYYELYFYKYVVSTTILMLGYGLIFVLYIVVPPLPYSVKQKVNYQESIQNTYK